VDVKIVLLAVRAVGDGVLEDSNLQLLSLRRHELQHTVFAVGVVLERG